MTTSGTERSEPPAAAGELRRVCVAVFEVARRLTYRPEDNNHVPLSELPPVRLPEVDPSTRIGRLAFLALPENAAHVLRLLVAAELDRGVLRVAHELARSSGETGVAVEAILALAAGMGISELAARAALAPLVAHGLVEWVGAEGPTLTRRLMVPERVLRYTVGAPLELCPDLPLLPRPPRGLDELCLGASEPPPPVLVERLLQNMQGHPPWIVGPQSIGKRTLVASVAAELGLATLTLDHRQIAKRRPADLVPLLWRETLIEGALVCIHDVDLAGDAAPGVIELHHAICAAGLPAVFTSVAAPALADFTTTPPLVELPMPSDGDRLDLWRRLLPDCPGVDNLASRFRLAPGRIVRVAAAAHEAAGLAGRATGAEHVAQAVSRAVGQRIATLANRIEDRQTWDDLVLPPETLDAVHEMISRVEHRHQVLDAWGFQRKLAKGTGVVALFDGPPGTGKTMVAGLIARQLGLELYQVDLSRMVSKWVGETEKNLAQVFDAADGANVMLLFDEADSLFSQRSEVKSAHDRHSNAEVNYLLQRVERFQGVSVLTTNFEGSIDAAFKRRLAFHIQFAMPGVAERALLWRRVLPAEAAVAGDLDFDDLARRYEMSGGRIRNAILRAAFLAARDRQPISRAHLARAITLEYHDAGKLTATGRLM